LEDREAGGDGGFVVAVLVVKGALMVLLAAGASIRGGGGGNIISSSRASSISEASRVVNFRCGASPTIVSLLSPMGVVISSSSSSSSTITGSGLFFFRETEAAFGLETGAPSSLEELVLPLFCSILLNLSAIL
jgi:hypothetical protein